jgi:lipopolysaccharide export system protein LptA
MRRLGIVSVRPLRRCALAALLALGASAVHVAAAEAQVVPRLPGTGADRPAPRPAGEPRLPGRPAQERAAPGDTVPGDTAGGRDLPPDPVYDRLKALEGYVPVEFTGDSAEFDARTRVLRLRGNPDVAREGTRLTARDSIVYRERSEFVEVFGNPRVVGEGSDVAGDRMVYHLGTRRARVLGARTTITDGATWFVHGDVTSEEEGGRVYAAGSTFTSDDREEPAYHFRAGEIKVIRNRLLVGRPAYLYFRNVPVMVLPFIVQDLEQGRRSGFLAPRFDITDVVRTGGTRGGGGTGRQISNVGFYWAVNDYFGAEMAGEWRSESWTGLTGNVQFNHARRFLRGNLGVTNFWREDAPRTTNVNADLSWDPDERTSLRSQIRWNQSAAFERDRTLNPFYQTSDVSSTLSASRRMDWGTVSGGAERRQSVGTGDVTLSPNVSFSPNPIALFSGTGWPGDATLSVSGSGSMTRVTPGEDPVERRMRFREDGRGNVSANLRLGQMGINTSAGYSREVLGPLAARAVPENPADTLDLPRSATERIEFNAGTGYQINLFGATRVTPNIGISQGLARMEMPDSLRLSPPAAGSPEDLAYGRMVAGAPRMRLSAALNTELFGFFPGFGEYSRIRHHITPQFNYQYSPAVAHDTIQTLIFGRDISREQNRLTLNLTQTFEAKLRPRAAPPAGEARQRPEGEADPAAQLPAAADAAAAPDAAGEGGGAAAAPPEARKITLLAINTSMLAHNFVPTDTLGTRFETEDVSNSLRSDLFGGFSLDISHSLWTRERGPGGTPVRGRFAPYLTSLGTGFRFDASSAIFRRLGLAGGQAEAAPAAPQGEGEPAEERQNVRGNNPFGRDMPRMGGASGGGPWSVDLRYSLRRARPDETHAFPILHHGDSQEIQGGINFSPSRNWSVGWQTGYSITDGEFHTHHINLRRDLYRWQANFNFIRTPSGNTAFSFEVHLTDLPDLKADWREQNLGGERQP